MRTCKDKQFDLAIVDPQFGIRMSKQIGKKKNEKGDKWGNKKWDEEPPRPEYFSELFRVSKNQIIMGGNYFNLPPTRCFIVWDKVQRIDQADCEFAWTSFDSSARIFTYPRSNLQGFRNPYRFHPTEKPIEYYKYLLKNYAHPGDTLLDTHSGSGSFRIAAYDMGFDLVSCEIDADYCRDNEARYQAHIMQQELIPVQEIQQLTFGDK